jgi:hypothetical protein
MKKKLSYLIQTLLLLVVFSSAFAQSNVLPSAKTSAPQYKTVIVEVVSPIVIYEYSPVLDIVDLVKDIKPTFTHPELTLQAYFSAMRSLNYEAYLNSWTKNSQTLMQEKNKKYKLDETKWKTMWAAAFVGKKIQLLNWITYGKYVLMQYKVSPNSNLETSETTVALTLENGEWKLTQELTSDQLLTSWNNPTGRVRVPSDAMLFKSNGK